MKILFYGNCQTEATMKALMARNPDVSFEYSGNSNRVAKFDEARTNKLMDWCDHIITQPVMKLTNPDHHEILRARFDGKISFMPYIWVDGLFSLSAAPGAGALRRDSGRTGIIGEELIIAHIREFGSAQTIAGFLSGQIDFKHQARLDSSLTELARREESADVRVSDFIRDRYKTEQVMLTHNHPHPSVINEIASQLGTRLGLTYSPITTDEPMLFSAITLPEFGKVLSPYTVQDLGLETPHDLHWRKAGLDLIAEIANAVAGTHPDRVEMPGEPAEINPAVLARREAARNARIAARVAERRGEIAKPVENKKQPAKPAAGQVKVARIKPPRPLYRRIGSKILRLLKLR